MRKEEVMKRLYDRYIKPTENKKNVYIGVEIEMPIVNLEHKPVDFEIVHRLTGEFLKEFHFTPTGIDGHGNIYSALNKENGDIFSYDCSYNNMEFSFGKESELHSIHGRFRRYYDFVQDFFKTYNYTLTGMGINPNRLVNNNIPIENGRYKMLFHHLSSFSKYAQLPMYFHRYPQFGMFASASQVQLDVTKNTLPEVINIFNQIEPIKAILFSNSVLLGENEDLLCCRDMLWENSTHGINPHNVGMYDCEIKTVDDILNYISTTAIYCVERDGKYLNFKPVNILKYFTLEKLTGEYLEDNEIRSVEFQPKPEDIAYLRTFKFEDLTYRGTVEFRSACCQPISDVMTVSAFHLGLLNKTSVLAEIIKNDTVLYHKGYNSAELRKQLVKRELPAYIDENGLYALAQSVLDVCKEGLRERGFGEEIYISPLYERIEKRTNPARSMLDRLNSGVHIDEIVREYS